MIVLRSALFNAWFFGTTALLGAIGIFVRAFTPWWTLRLAQLWAATALYGSRGQNGGPKLTGSTPINT